MIDLHNHILWGVDDGPKTIEESIEMARVASEDGIKAIVATPHFIPGSYETSGLVVRQKAAILNDYLKLRKIPVTIHSGQELYLDLKTGDRLKSGENLTLAGSKYILVEFPMAEIPHYADQALFNLMVQGYQPIIAHPERIAEVQEDITSLIPLIHKGCLLQINAMSLTGGFGKRAKRTAEKLIEFRMAHLMGSDAHNTKTRAPQILKALYLMDKGKSVKHRAQFLERARQVVSDEMVDWLEPATEREISESRIKRFSLKAGCFW